MKPTLTELEELARAATPGPWSNIGVCKSYTKKIEAPEGLIGFCHTNHMAKNSIDNGIANARFIAAASPDTVLKLIKAVRVMREALLKYHKEQEGRAALGLIADGCKIIPKIETLGSEALTTVQKLLGESK